MKEPNLDTALDLFEAYLTEYYEDESDSGNQDTSVKNEIDYAIEEIVTEFISDHLASFANTSGEFVIAGLLQREGIPALVRKLNIHLMNDITGQRVR